MSQVRRALRVGGGVWATEEIASVGQERSDDILEDVALGHDVAGGDVKGVSGDGVPVVVDCVQQGVASDLGSATRGVVDVVALQGDQVVGASEVDSPVVVAVAGCAPACVAVELAVGERHAVGG